MLQHLLRQKGAEAVRIRAEIVQTQDLSGIGVKNIGLIPVVSVSAAGVIIILKHQGQHLGITAENFYISGGGEFHRKVHAVFPNIGVIVFRQHEHIVVPGAGSFRIVRSGIESFIQALHIGIDRLRGVLFALDSDNGCVIPEIQDELAPLFRVIGFQSSCPEVDGDPTGIGRLICRRDRFAVPSRTRRRFRGLNRLPGL